MSVPIFITYRDRREFLDRTLVSLVDRGFDDITIIDNDSAEPLTFPEWWSEDDAKLGFKVVHSDNSHRHLAPWLMDLVPDDDYYIVMDCDIELDCPDDVESVLIHGLENHPEIVKLGLGIRVDDFLFPPPQHYSYSYLMEYSVERGTRYQPMTPHHSGDPRIINAPIDTHFAMYRPGSGWPGIVGARTMAPYLCRHLPWYNEEYSDEERLYYERAGNAWTMGHSAGTLLETTVAVPFTQLHAETTVALTGETVRYAPMLFDTSYWELLRDLWQIGQSFIVVEHDIVVNETTLDELRACDSDWCAMPFPYRDDPAAFSLACTKFSAKLIARHPELMESVGICQDDGHPPGHWCRLDMWIYQILTNAGEKRCEHAHSEPVTHLGPRFPKHGCLVKS